MSRGLGGAQATGGDRIGHHFEWLLASADLLNWQGHQVGGASCMRCFRAPLLAARSVSDLVLLEAKGLV